MVLVTLAILALAPTVSHQANAVRVEYPDGVIVEHRTQETVPETGAAAVPRDRLPEALRRQLDELRAYFGGGPPMRASGR